jgi:PHD/YefM family antitoxin component YafN of YafNO toxin-antitoxin module
VGFFVGGLIKSRDSCKLRFFAKQGQTMQIMSANEAKTRFGAFLDQAQHEPVGVMRHDRLLGVLVSAQDFEAMRVFYANRLMQTLHASAAAAEQAGMTPDILASLLADES